MRISVIGTGYLGTTHAACMAELGFEVVGLDSDPKKIEQLASGVLPFHEPGLPELLRKHTASGRLRFTTSYAEVGAWADVHFIAVGTPQKAGDHAADMTYVDGATSALAGHITRDCLIVGKSTVPVGTARRLGNLVRESTSGDVKVDLLWNPEFLREGYAVEDTLRPDRLVAGGDSAAAIDLLKLVYAKALKSGTPFISTDLETAELVKAAANAFLATKISFINAFSEVTEHVGGDIRVLADAIGLDNRIGRRFLNAGVGFGGGCLPKDIRALQARVSELGLDRTMRFLSEVDEINLRRRDRVVHLATEILKDLQGRKIAVLGVAFKPHSDDVRDSPALDVAAQLFNAGADVSVFDPEAMENARKRFPRLNYTKSAAEALENSALTILLTEWDEFKELNPTEVGDIVESKAIIDGRNVLHVQDWLDAGWRFESLGRRSV
ncbi:UDP-glucose/GDP-mannose dehydrogenase family protein [Arthrobacter sp. SO5]|uniref:UDP-glucose dehydrogenase family protein n=1 Tax=Arthrobacter sp. SO5 TaxID=1897055 RepID=UPI001E6366E5|nr:UDP-glucose/GDP-mannose dehydrogenase family protein [Arthrobacter sp. SO5]